MPTPATTLTDSLTSNSTVTEAVTTKTEKPDLYPECIDQLSKTTGRQMAMISYEAGETISHRWKLLSLLPFLIATFCFLPRISQLWRHTETPAIASVDINSRVSNAKFLTRPIEEIRPGDRVLAHNPEVTDEERVSAIEPDPKTWRLIEMLLTGEDGQRCSYPTTEAY